MKKISNREEGNQYYNLVNKYVDEYVIDHKIRPSNLKKYFSNNLKLETFLKKYQLDDVDGIKRVVHDVVEDRYAAEKDGIIKFEKFILNEDLGNINIKESDVNYEKILADAYHSSVGHITPLDENEHKYQIKDFGEEKNVIIYTKGDVDDFKKSIIPILINRCKNEVVNLKKVDVGLESSKQIKLGISLPLKDIISDEKLSNFISNSLDRRKILGMISSLINNTDVTNSGSRYKYVKNFKGNNIWELLKSK